MTYIQWLSTQTKSIKFLCSWLLRSLGILLLKKPSGPQSRYEDSQARRALYRKTLICTTKNLFQTHLVYCDMLPVHLHLRADSDPLDPSHTHQHEVGGQEIIRQIIPDYTILDTSVSLFKALLLASKITSQTSRRSWTPSCSTTCRRPVSPLSNLGKQVSANHII